MRFSEQGGREGQDEIRLDKRQYSLWKTETMRQKWAYKKLKHKYKSKEHADRLNVLFNGRLGISFPISLALENVSVDQV